MLKHLALVFIALLSLIACQPKIAEIDPDLVLLLAANPETDAERAIQAQDFRFIMVHNHQLNMTKTIPECWVETHGYRVYSNQHLAYGSYEFQTYGAVATLYANWYNNRIREALESMQQPECSFAD
jgi:hypothetical protein